MTPRLRCALLGIAALIAVSGSAETVKDREGAVRGDKAAMEKDPRWLYNDIDAAFAKAQRTGKPLLVVLRCVPCLACMGIDASVLTSPQLAPLLDQFVCLRLINANAIDLTLFQFDYDLSFSTLFFNADHTVYGRFGSWTHQKNAQETDLAGFTRALEAVLAIHRDYPANKDALAGKQGGPSPFKTPVEIPELAGKYGRELDWNGKVVASCVHCHQIGDAFRAHFREQGKPIPAEWIYPQPAPETIGLKLAPNQVATVESVGADSPAARAGVQAGDALKSIAGQPLISIADVSWVLHRGPEAGALPVVVERGGQSKAIEITLPPDWRSKSDISRRVGTWGMRGMACGGLLLVDLTDEERNQRGIALDAMGLRVTHVGEYGIHAAAKKAGFKKDDLIVNLDDRSERVSESEVIGRLLRGHRPGDQLKTTVLRGQERLDLSLPMQ